MFQTYAGFEDDYCKHHNQCQYDDILMENISVNRERQISVGTAGPQLRVQDVR